MSEIECLELSRQAEELAHLWHSGQLSHVVTELHNKSQSVGLALTAGIAIRLTGAGQSAYVFLMSLESAAHAELAEMRRQNDEKH
jgi:hypothetical protein